MGKILLISATSRAIAPLKLKIPRPLTLLGSDYVQTNKMRKENAPCIKPTGKHLRWGYNSNAGCHNTERRHVRGEMKQTGIRWEVTMQRARRGGVSVLPIFRGKLMVTYRLVAIRILRLEITLAILLSRLLTRGVVVERNSAQLNSNPDAVELEMGVGSYAGFPDGKSIPCSQILTPEEDSFVPKGKQISLLRNHVSIKSSNFRAHWGLRLMISSCLDVLKQRNHYEFFLTHQMIGRTRLCQPVTHLCSLERWQSLSTKWGISGPL